jgi:hypothetical protein
MGLFPSFLLMSLGSFFSEAIIAHHPAAIGGFFFIQRIAYDFMI